MLYHTDPAIQLQKYLSVENYSKAIRWRQAAADARLRHHCLTKATVLRPSCGPGSLRCISKQTSWLVSDVFLIFAKRCIFPARWRAASHRVITQLIDDGASDHDSAMVVAGDKQGLLGLAHVGFVRRAGLQFWRLVGGTLSILTTERQTRKNSWRRDEPRDVGGSGEGWVGASLSEEEHSGRSHEDHMRST